MNEETERTTEEPEEEATEDEESVISLTETVDDVKALKDESVGRAKDVVRNPVREFAAEIVDTAADAIDGFFNTFESVFSGRRKRRKPPRKD